MYDYTKFAEHVWVCLLVSYYSKCLTEEISIKHLRGTVASEDAIERSLCKLCISILSVQASCAVVE